MGGESSFELGGPESFGLEKVESLRSGRKEKERGEEVSGRVNEGGRRTRGRRGEEERRRDELIGDAVEEGRGRERI